MQDLLPTSLVLAQIYGNTSLAVQLGMLKSQFSHCSENWEEINERILHVEQLIHLSSHILRSRAQLVCFVTPYDIFEKQQDPGTESILLRLLKYFPPKMQLVQITLDVENLLSETLNKIVHCYIFGYKIQFSNKLINRLLTIFVLILILFFFLNWN